MNIVVRAEYQASLRADAVPETVQHAVERLQQSCRQQVDAGQAITASAFRFRDQLFLYVEQVVDEEYRQSAREQAYTWLPDLGDVLTVWPGLRDVRGGAGHQWALMNPVFWHCDSEQVRDWARHPKDACGKIAVLEPAKVASYVCHHQRIVAEGLLMGERTQLISLKGNVLFSVFDLPQGDTVNLSGRTGESEELARWVEADPDSHFQRLAEDPERCFVTAQTLFVA